MNDGPPDIEAYGVDEPLSVGQVAALTGLSSHTLRWYERVGLLKDVARDRSGRRQYTQVDLRWLTLLKRLRATGMPISEMLRYAELVRAEVPTELERVRLLETHRDRVLDHIADLQRDLEVIDRKISVYRRPLESALSPAGASPLLDHDPDGGAMTTPTTATRTLGRSDRTVSPIGFGCWAIGGPAFRDGNPIGWGKVDDEESVAAIHAALEAGITFFDTAAIYGAGHSERVLGRALAGRWDEVVVATKFGNLFDEATRQATGRDASPASIRQQCDQSLARLGTDVIDLFQFHTGDYDPVRAQEVVATLDDLVAAGKIRSFGWSTHDPERAKVFARSPNCTAVQFRTNLVEDKPAMVDLLEAENLAGINTTPLAKGVLTGKFTRTSTFADDDIRDREFDFAGNEGRTLDALDQIRDILTSGGRTIAQGALCWLLARSPAFVPIPGIRTIAQAKDNAGAIAHGPLNDTEMSRIRTALETLGTSPT